LENELEDTVKDFGKHSIIIKAVSRKKLAEEEVRELIRDLLYNIGKSCLNEGAKAIGHIKAYIKTPNGSLKASVTSRSLNVEINGSITSTITELEIYLATIVYKLPQNAVKQIVEKQISEIVNKKEGLELKRRI
jgi:hypothetical protein